MRPHRRGGYMAPVGPPTLTVVVGHGDAAQCRLLPCGESRRSSRRCRAASPAPLLTRGRRGPLCSWSFGVRRGTTCGLLRRCIRRLRTRSVNAFHLWTLPSVRHHATSFNKRVGSHSITLLRLSSVPNDCCTLSHTGSAYYCGWKQSLQRCCQMRSEWTNHWIIILCEQMCCDG